MTTACAECHTDIIKNTLINKFNQSSKENTGYYQSTINTFHSEYKFKKHLNVWVPVLAIARHTRLNIILAQI